MCPLKGQEGTRSLGMVLDCPGGFAGVFRMYSENRLFQSLSEWIRRQEVRGR